MGFGGAGAACSAAPLVGGARLAACGSGGWVGGREGRRPAPGSGGDQHVGSVPRGRHSACASWALPGCSFSAGSPATRRQRRRDGAAMLPVTHASSCSPTDTRAVSPEPVSMQEMTRLLAILSPLLNAQTPRPTAKRELSRAGCRLLLAPWDLARGVRRARGRLSVRQVGRCGIAEIALHSCVTQMYVRGQKEVG